MISFFNILGKLYECTVFSTVLFILAYCFRDTEAKRSPHPVIRENSDFHSTGMEMRAQVFTYQ